MNNPTHSPNLTPSQNPKLHAFNGCDLPIDEQGRAYHLQIRPEELAPNILIVGDPGRAEAIGEEFFTDIEVNHEHRGLRTVTGMVQKEENPMRTTVVTSGMGTPSLEIIVQEIAALNEIDFESRTRKQDYPKLSIIRVGTSGGLQKETPLGTPIISSYTVGLDNTGLFYDVGEVDGTSARLEKEIGDVLSRAMNPESRLRGKIAPYAAKIDPKVISALQHAANELGIETITGLTASNSGFFANQGRNIARISPSVPDIDQILAEYDPCIDGQKFENMEMEASFLNYFMGGLGYFSGTICTAIANRREDTFDHNYIEATRNATSIALRALAKLR